jgi:4-amino-4-deoxy-L-arabinose transferase
MALSITLFGANEFAVRLPSLIMTSALILVVYKMGKAIFDLNTAFIAAFIFSCYEPLLEMNSGMKGMDHDDVAFLFYVMLSIWAWIYFEKTAGRRYLLLIGFFSGCAILCKWLTGLLVFSGFAFYHLFMIRDLFAWATVRDIFIALAVCLLTFLPWQIYIYTHYPVIAHYENAYNTKHLYKVVEGHEHETWYYFHLLGKYYKGLEILILIGMGYCLFYARRYALAISIAFMWVLVYIFFTIARTKVESYVMLVAPIGILFVAASISLLIDGSLRSDRWRYLVGSICFIALFWIFTDVPSISAAHFTADNWEGWTRKYKLPAIQRHSEGSLSECPKMRS